MWYTRWPETSMSEVDHPCRSQQLEQDPWEDHLPLLGRYMHSEGDAGVHTTMCWIINESLLQPREHILLSSLCVRLYNLNNVQ